MAKSLCHFFLFDDFVSVLFCLNLGRRVLGVIVGCSCFTFWGVDQGFWGLKEEWTHPKMFVGSTPFSGWGTKPHLHPISPKLPTGWAAFPERHWGAKSFNGKDTNKSNCGKNPHPLNIEHPLNGPRYASPLLNHVFWEVLNIGGISSGLATPLPQNPSMDRMDIQLYCLSISNIHINIYICIIIHVYPVKSIPESMNHQSIHWFIYIHPDHYPYITWCNP